MYLSIDINTMEYLTEVLSVLVASGIKFMLGIGLVILYDFSFWFGFGLSVAGGIGGMFIFLFFGPAIDRIWNNMPWRRNKVKKKFKWTRRLIVRIKQHGGLLIIALLTPLVLTIPFGVLSSLSLGYGWKEIIPSMIMSILFWSALLLGLYHLIGFDLSRFLEDLILS